MEWVMAGITIPGVMADTTEDITEDITPITEVPTGVDTTMVFIMDTTTEDTGMTITVPPTTSMAGSITDIRTDIQVDPE